MKFTKELKYNAVEEWRNHYVNYAAFKRIIYGEEKRRFGELGPASSGKLRPSRSITPIIDSNNIPSKLLSACPVSTADALVPTSCHRSCGIG